MRCRRVGRRGHRVADVAADDDHRGTIADQRGLADRALESVGVFGGLAEVGNVPAVRLEATSGVVAERQFGAAVDRDVVVVVHGNQAAELLVAGERCCLVADALHQVAVADDHERAMVHQVGAQAGTQAALGHRHADGVGKALSQWTRGDLHAGREAVLGVAGRDRSKPAEVSDVVERDAVAHQVRHGVDEHRGVAGRQDEAVAVGPIWRCGVVAQDAGEQHMR